MIVAALILSIVALVVAGIAMAIVIATEKRIHTSVKNDITNGIAAWVKKFSDDINIAIPQLVQAKINDAVAAADIPGSVSREVAKHQQGVLLLEGNDASSK